MNLARGKPKVLIGTPVHVSKDYAMERWLQSVAKLQLEYPADLLLVDNSPDLDYIEKIKSYCATYGLTNYKIKYFEIQQGTITGKSIGEQEHERIGRCREIIRADFLAGDYDAYFFWENDILIPPDSLGKLVALMKAGDFMIVVHNCWINSIPNMPNFDYGIVLFNRECLKKYDFLPESETNPEIPESWYYAEEWHRRRLLRDGRNYAKVSGLIEPVYHLAD